MIAKLFSTLRFVGDYLNDYSWTTLPYFVILPLAFVIPFLHQDWEQKFLRIVPLLFVQIIWSLSIFNFVLLYWCVTVSVTFNLDALLCLQTRHHDALLTRRPAIKLLRKLYIYIYGIVLKLYALWWLIINLPINDYYKDIICVIRFQDEKSIAASRGYVAVTSSTIHLSNRFQLYKPSIQSHPTTYVRSIESGFVTTQDCIIRGHLSDTSDIHEVSYGYSALIPALQPFEVPDQEAVADSMYGTRFEDGEEDWDLFYESPVFAVSYLHRNYEQGSMVKVDPAVWKRVNSTAAMLTRATGCTHYTLWIDSCVRSRRLVNHVLRDLSDEQRQSIFEHYNIDLDDHDYEDNNAPWYVYGLLPYTLMHTITDDSESEVANERFWPYLERQLATMVGKQYTLSNNSRIEFQPPFFNVSPITAIRKVALQPKLHSGQLKVTFYDDALMLQSILKNIACADFSYIQSDSTSPHGLQKRAALEALWLCVHAVDQQFPLEELTYDTADRPLIPANEFDAVLHTLGVHFDGVPSIPGWPRCDFRGLITARLFIIEDQDWTPKECLVSIVCALKVGYLSRKRKILPYCLLVFGDKDGGRVDRNVKVELFDPDSVSLQGRGYPLGAFIRLVHQ